MKSNYKSLVIVGSQWGDEGKGKLIDYFAQKANAVVRFAGGDNAGHLIEFEKHRYKVSIIPSGIFNPKVINIIGNGVVINLEKLIFEIQSLQTAKIDTSNLYISNRAHLIFDYHILLDELEEEERKTNKIGTTKRGIGPAYAAKASRFGVRICDVFNKNFKAIFKENFDHYNSILQKVYQNKSLIFEEIYQKFIMFFDKIKHQIIDTGEFITTAIKNNQFVLIEGAQGVLLDIDHGTYPFVTSSNCSANNVATGIGVHRNLINKVIGVVKAYNSRVGAGAMPTEIFDETCAMIRKRGNEFGSNTKRPRRIGWLDIVALKYAIRVGGIDELFLTLLDVLDNQNTIKLCIAYELNGQQLTSMPASNEDLLNCKPIFIELPGWNEDISQVKSYDDLPKNAKNYIKKIAELVEVEFIGVSVGPDRNQTIIMKEVFE